MITRTNPAFTRETQTCHSDLMMALHSPPLAYLSDSVLKHNISSFTPGPTSAHLHLLYTLPGKLSHPEFYTMGCSSGFPSQDGGVHSMKKRE